MDVVDRCVLGTLIPPPSVRRHVPLSINPNSCLDDVPDQHTRPQVAAYQGEQVLILHPRGAERVDTLKRAVEAVRVTSTAGCQIVPTSSVTSTTPRRGLDVSDEVKMTHCDD